jgi:hypothetical protein
MFEHFPVRGTNPTDDHISLLQSIFGTEQNVFRFPERLRFDKIDSVFRPVRFALLRVEFKVHDGLRNALTI